MKAHLDFDLFTIRRWIILHKAEQRYPQESHQSLSPSASVNYLDQIADWSFGGQHYVVKYPLGAEKAPTISGLLVYPSCAIASRAAGLPKSHMGDTYATQSHPPVGVLPRCRKRRR
ncbi:hypothetical protein LshimejAT787_0804020 [Lyophyllum shimeji]|uniref:Uncharacterized protein n=1 Tax=Lyophyllum shimeji TaxID=47721 RepID=A0A9P3PSL4_LYOSH|nr:hypothetical protein LshimejAT787_0804020 [Lyophyllum shimeji]